MKKLELNEGLEKIGTFAFADAIKLEEISLPNSLETIERLAFYGNLELKNLYYQIMLKILVNTL